MKIKYGLNHQMLIKDYLDYQLGSKMSRFLQSATVAPKIFLTYLDLIEFNLKCVMFISKNCSIKWKIYSPKFPENPGNDF
jgi:hypothetical protein